MHQATIGPKQLVCYVRKPGRLAQFRRATALESWDAKWLARTDSMVRHALRPRGRMASHGSFLRRWMSQKGLVLEAGCGTGLWVRRLSERGYRCIGLDYALSTLWRSKRIASDLPLVGGDVLNLPFGDCSVETYLSFGVVEHLEDGPGAALREAFRVLKPGGVALVSVPYENPYRQRVDTVTEQAATKRGFAFYQYYYFRPVAFLRELESVGLVPEYQALHFYGVHRGLREQNATARSVFPKLPFQSVWSPVLDLLPVLPKTAAHMMFAVSRKICKR